MRRYLVPSYPVRTAVLCVAMVTAVLAPLIAITASAPHTAPATPPAAAAADWTPIHPTPGPDDHDATVPLAGWTVTVRIPSGPDPDAPSADLGDQGQANALAAAVAAAGFRPRVECVNWPGRPPSGANAVLGWRVRVGVYGDEALAVAAATPIHAAGFATIIDPLLPNGN